MSWYIGDCEKKIRLLDGSRFLQPTVNSEHITIISCSQLGILWLLIIWWPLKFERSYHTSFLSPSPIPSPEFNFFREKAKWSLVKVYHQIFIDPKYIYKTAIIATLSFYKLPRMRVGLRNNGHLSGWCIKSEAEGSENFLSFLMTFISHLRMISYPTKLSLYCQILQHLNQYGPIE